MKLIDPGPSDRGWHQFQKALQCPRKYALSYRVPKDQVVREASDALVKGSLIHVGLAHVYGLRRGDTDLYSPEDAIAELSRRELETTGNELWEKHRELAQHVVRQYELFWAHEDWTPLLIEEQFKAQVPGPSGMFLYTQRADLVVQDSMGLVWIVDHKTTFRISSRTVARYVLSGQFLGYRLFGQKIFKKKFGGVLLILIGLPQTTHDQPVFQRPTFEAAPYGVRTF